MGEPAKLEGAQLAEVVERAMRTVAAIDADAYNPAFAPFGDRIAAELAGARDVDAILATMREAVSALVAELDLFAIALVTVTDGGQVDGRERDATARRRLRRVVALELDHAELLRYVDEAKAAAGSNRVSGEPLAEFIRRVLQELADQLELNKALAAATPEGDSYV